MAAQLRDVEALNRGKGHGMGLSNQMPGEEGGLQPYPWAPGWGARDCSCASHRSRGPFEGEKSLDLTCGNPRGVVLLV